MLNSISTIGFVRYIETVRSWEGPLWEVSLYIYSKFVFLKLIKIFFPKPLRLTNFFTILYQIFKIDIFCKSLKLLDNLMLMQ